MVKTANHRSLPLPACLLLPLCWLGAQFPADAAEPTYLGRPLSHWTGQLEDSHESARLQAVFALGEFGPAATPALQALLRHKEPALRQRAALGLGKLGSAKGLPKETRSEIVAALRVALSDGAGTVRVSAAAALAHCGQAGPALEVLSDAFSDPVEVVRIEAAAALHDLGEAARPALPALRAATGDSSDYVKRLATRAVARLTTDAP